MATMRTLKVFGSNENQDKLTALGKVLKAEKGSGLVDDKYGIQKRVSRVFDVALTSYDAATGTGTVLNELKLTYDALGLVSKSEQDHASTVGVGTPAVDYEYHDDADVTSKVYVDWLRQHKALYPLVPSGTKSAQVVNYYGEADSVNDRLSRHVYLLPVTLPDLAIRKNDLRHRR